jgi:uncharacterized protein YdhG (YjbR/CyaY superfamily)
MVDHVSNKPTSIEEYLETLPDDVRARVEQVRQIVDEMVPDGEGCISYAIPAVKLRGKIVVYYSGWKQHLSMYPIPPGSSRFEKLVSPYIAGKGTLKFPMSEPLPVHVIREVVSAHLIRLDTSLPTKVATGTPTPKKASRT